MKEIVFNTWQTLLMIFVIFTLGYMTCEIINNPSKINKSNYFENKGLEIL